MVAVRGTARLLRVVADHRAFLLAVQRLDRGVGVQNPGASSSGATLSDRCPSSQAPLGFRDALSGLAQRVFGDHLSHAQQSRIDAIAADRRSRANSACGPRAPTASRCPARPPCSAHSGWRSVSGQLSSQRDHNPVRVRNSMKYANCPIGVAALSLSQRTCTRPAIVCTPRARHQHLFSVSPASISTHPSGDPRPSLKNRSLPHSPVDSIRQMRFLVSYD